MNKVNISSRSSIKVHCKPKTRFILKDRSKHQISGKSQKMASFFSDDNEEEYLRVKKIYNADGTTTIAPPVPFNRNPVLVNLMEKTVNCLKTKVELKSIKSEGDSICSICLESIGSGSKKTKLN